MKKCPFCAEEIQDEAIVCRFCGRELNEQAQAKVTPAPTGQEKSNTGRLLVGAGAVCLLIGMFLPWALVTSTLLGMNLSLYGYQGDGIISGIIGLILSIGALISKGKPGKQYSIASVIFGVIAGFLVCPKVFTITTAISENESVFGAVGPGIYLSIVGIILIVIGGLIRVPEFAKQS